MISDCQRLVSGPSDQWLPVRDWSVAQVISDCQRLVSGPSDQWLSVSDWSLVIGPSDQWLSVSDWSVAQMISDCYSVIGQWPKWSVIVSDWSVAMLSVIVSKWSVTQVISDCWSGIGQWPCYQWLSATGQWPKWSVIVGQGLGTGEQSGAWITDPSNRQRKSTIRDVCNVLQNCSTFAEGTYTVMLQSAFVGSAWLVLWPWWYSIFNSNQWGYEEAIP